MLKNTHLRQILLFLVLGCVLMAIQLLIFCSTAYPGHPVHGYSQTFMWDSAWYESIVVRGYQATIPAYFSPEKNNAVFFPGFPRLIKLTSQILHISPRQAIPLTAQFFCIIFWACCLQVLRQLKIGLHIQLLLILGILAHPLAFVLVIGYSESLFLASLLGLLCAITSESFTGYLMQRNTNSSAFLKMCFLAGLCGFSASSTRLVGLPLALSPMVYGLLILGIQKIRTHLHLYTSLVATSVFAASGAALFFLLCELLFGKWNVYFLIEKAAWGLHTDLAQILKPSLYIGRQIRMDDLFGISIADLNSWSFAVTATLLVIVIGIDLFKNVRQRSANIKQRLVLYYCACTMFFVTASAGGIKESIVRYHFPIHILLFLAVAYMVHERGKKLYLATIVSLMVVIAQSSLIQHRVIADVVHAGFYP